MAIKAEYIWLDGTEPTAKMRSKTKILSEGAEPPIWGFDGSSTNQAEGNSSDCVLRPVKVVPDPIRGGDDVLGTFEAVRDQVLRFWDTLYRHDWDGVAASFTDDAFYEDVASAVTWLSDAFDFHENYGGLEPGITPMPPAIAS
jgi:hypothetical protein